MLATLSHAIEAARKAVETDDLDQARYWLERAAELVEVERGD